MLDVANTAWTLPGVWRSASSRSRPGTASPTLPSSSLLRGDPDLDPTLEEGSQFDTGAGLITEPVPVAYNPAIPIETFEVIFTDECHRSIYNLWRQVLEYFDAHLIGLTATPSKQTFGFFNQNLVMEYNHEQAVADGVNVDFDVYRIRTQITQAGSTIDAGDWDGDGSQFPRPNRLPPPWNFCSVQRRATSRP